MRPFTVITDSCCSLSADEVRELGLVVLPLSFTIDGRTYADTPDHADLSPRDFFARIREGKDCTTAAVNVDQYLAAMRAELSAGRDVLCVCFSSALSCTYQNACIAGEELSSEFPDSRIEVVDSLCACRGMGMLLWRAVREQRENNLTLEETAAFVLREREHQGHWFFVDDLHHLHRGGRVSKLVAVAGSMLQVKPIMHCDSEGRLTPSGKARGVNGALKALAEKMAELRSSPDEHQTVFICHADCEDRVEALKALLREEFGTTDVRTDFICPVVGAHTGCGTLGLFFTAVAR